ncbi:MAG: hypothetical protein HQL58_08995 [Magnetococcales bacterium]|nr:hypothetical protein [Magnetococcales bacterium]
MSIKDLWSKLLLRKDHYTGQGGMFWNKDGLSLVTVEGVREETPQVKQCLWIPWDGPAGKAPMLSALANEHGLLKIPFNFCLELDSYDLFPNEAADVNAEELAAAMKWVIRDRLSFSVEEAVVDCFFIPEPIRVLPQRRVYVVAVQKNIIAEHLTLLRPSRLLLQAIEVTELALNNILAYLPESKSGVGLLYYPPDKESGTLVVSKGDNLYFTRRMKTLNKEAMEFGLDPIKPIADEVQRALDFVTTTFTGTPIVALYLAADARTEQQLREPLATHLSVRLKKLHLDNFLQSDEAVDDELLFHCLPALGEALRPVEESE